MSLIQAIILGLVQGLTEFFPVSSSAHLRMAKWLMGLPDAEGHLYFDLLCHFGTLLALLLYLKRDVYNILKSPKMIALYLLALIPLIPAYFLLKPLRTAASHPAYLGYALLITAALLFASLRIKKVAIQKKSSHVLCIGIMQTIALIPGISRSGSTIAAARFCGWSFSDAARFSFLLAIPTILGGEILETWKGQAGSPSLPTSCYWAGMIASFALGLISVRFIFWIYEKQYVKPFAWYCLVAALFAWTIYHG